MSEHRFCSLLLDLPTRDSLRNKAFFQVSLYLLLVRRGLA